MGDVSRHLLDFRVPDRFRLRGIQKVGRVAEGLRLPPSRTLPHLVASLEINAPHSYLALSRHLGMHE